MNLSLKVVYNSEKLLGITIDSDFTFEEHINMLCPKASQKLHTSRISQYQNPKSRFYSTHL